MHLVKGQFLEYIKDFKKKTSLNIKTQIKLNSHLNMEYNIKQSP